jgi:spore coat polysaccharide biosynthesis protein SpsF
MLPLAGKPVIVHVYERTKHCRNIERIIIATTTNKKDEAIVKLFENVGVTIFRGSEKDPLDRFFRAATEYNLQHIVRIMADCPVVDPNVVDAVITYYFRGNYDFCCLGGEFPSGLDVTVFSYPILKKAWEKTERLSDREHIIPYMQKHPELFRMSYLELFRGLYHHRWVLDHECDYKLLNEIYNELYEPGKIFTTKDILELFDRKPEIAKLNAHIPRTII